MGVPDKELSYYKEKLLCLLQEQRVPLERFIYRNDSAITR
jgi:hypothetical protein